MKKTLTLAINKPNRLTQELSQVYDISYYKPLSWFSKLFKAETYPDIYFHKGVLNDTKKVLVQKAKLVLVSSYGIKKDILSKLPDIAKEKIVVLYPYLKTSAVYSIERKQQIKADYDILDNIYTIVVLLDKVDKDGVGFVINTLQQLSQKNFVVIFSSTTKIQTSIKTQLKSLDSLNIKPIVLEEHKDIDSLLIASDICLFPVKYKYFMQDVLKSLYFYNATFVIDTNHTAELVDPFSLIQGYDDVGLSFKLDSLLSNKDELIQIQEENHIKVEKYSFKDRFTKLQKLIKHLNL